MNGKDYNKKEIVVGDGYELIKLGDISDINMGSTPSTNNHNYWDNGKIPWVSIAELNNNIIYDTKKHITKEGELTMKNRKISINSILLSFKLSIGKLAIAGVEMYCNEAIVYLNSKIKKISQMYIYYILEGLDLEKYGRGTIGSHGNLNKEILTNLQIPVPKSEKKITEWVNKISKPYTKKNENEKLIMKLEEEIKNKIKIIGDNEECEEVELGSICDINNKKIIRYDTSYGKETGKYKFHTGATDGKYLCNEYNIDKYTIILNKTNGSGKCNIFLDKNISCAKQTYICQSINNELETQYIYYYLFDKKDKLEVGYIGACHKNLSYDFLIKLKIKLPKNKQLIKDFDPLFQQIEKLQTELKEAETQYKQLIKELSEEAIPPNKQVVSLTKTNLVNMEQEDVKENTPSETSSTSSTMSIKSLHAQCKLLKIKGYTKYKKKEDKEKLLQLIKEHNKD